MRQLIENSLNNKVDDEMPEYIQRLMRYHKTSTKAVHLIYDEMLDGYEWLKDILRKEQGDSKMLNFPNIFGICGVLTNFNSITFRMPSNLEKGIFEKIKWSKGFKIDEPLEMRFWWEDTNDFLAYSVGEKVYTISSPEETEMRRSTANRSTWCLSPKNKQ